VRLRQHKGGSNVSGDPAEAKRGVAAIARRLGVCPACGRAIDGAGYGTGRTDDGVFCSLGCVADYWYGKTP